MNLGMRGGLREKRRGKDTERKEYKIFTYIHKFSIWTRNEKRVKGGVGVGGGWRRPMMIIFTWERKKFCERRERKTSEWERSRREYRESTIFHSLQLRVENYVVSCEKNSIFPSTTHTKESFMKVHVRLSGGREMHNKSKREWSLLSEKRKFSLGKRN